MAGAALLAVAGLSVAPLFFHATLPRGDDVGEHVQFVQDFSSGLRQGLLYPRWLPHTNLGYGAPVFIFYPPLATALVAGLHAAGLDLFAAFRLGIFFLTLAAAAGAFLLGSRRTGESSLAAGILTAAFWVLLPYHAVDLFSRFALAEAATFVFLPLLFLALDRRPQPHLAGTAAAFAGLALSHLPTAYLAAWISLAWVLPRGRRGVGVVVLALLLGVGCAALYVGPAVLERPLIHSDWLEQNPLYRFDVHYLFFPRQVEFQGDPIHSDVSGWLDTTTLGQIRLLVPLTLGLAAFAWLCRLLLRRPGRPADPMHRYMALALCATLGMTRLSDPIWRWLPGFASVAFPWRLSLFLTLAAALLMSAALADLWRYSSRRLALGAGMATLALSLGASLWIARSADWDTFTPAHSETPVVRLRAAGAFMPLSNPVMRGFRKGRTAGPAVLTSALGGTVGKVTPLEISNHRRVYQVTVPTAGTTALSFFQFDYPGWSILIDGHVTPHSLRPPFGTIAVPVPPGEHTVVLRFRNTLQRKVAACVSAFSLALLLALTLLGRSRTMGARRSV